MTIRVNNLPPNITDTDLIALFSEHGSVQKIAISEGRNAALVELAEDEEAVMAALNGQEWRGTTLELEFVSDDGSRDPGGPPSGSSKPPKKKQ